MTLRIFISSVQKEFAGERAARQVTPLVAPPVTGVVTGEVAGEVRGEVRGEVTAPVANIHFRKPGLMQELLTGRTRLV